MAITADDRWKEQARIEWDLWQKVCTRLVLANAVTGADLKGRAGDDSTNGQRLLNLIREWGDARATLALAHAAKKENPDG